MSSMGTLVNEHTVRFERILPGSIDRAWEFISTAEGLARWHRCIADYSIEPEVGGRITYRICPPPPPSNFTPPPASEAPPIPSRGLISKPIGLVREYVPSRVLTYSFIDPTCDLFSEVRFELREGDGQVHLVFTHAYLPMDMMAQVGAGWHVHLDSLIAALGGEELPDFMTVFMEQFKQYSAAVAATLVVVSAGSPALADNDTAYKVMNEQRARLLSTYDRVWKESDDIKYKLSVLARSTTEDTGRAQNDLERELKQKYDELRRVEMDIRDLDKSLK